jgi:hypothetical protein
MILPDHRPLNRRGTDEYVDTPVVGAHAVHCSRQLLVVANVGAEPQRCAAIVLDLHIGEIEFRLTPGEESHACAGGGEPERQAFADAAARTRNQHAFAFDSPHVFCCPASTIQTAAVTLANG